MRVAGTLHIDMDAASVDASHAEGPTRTRSIAIHSSFLSDIARELGTHGDVFLAMASEGPKQAQVAYVIIRDPDGSHHFPGECADRSEQALRNDLGARYEPTIDAIIGTTGRARIEHLVSSAEAQV